MSSWDAKPDFGNGTAHGAGRQPVFRHTLPASFLFCELQFALLSSTNLWGAVNRCVQSEQYGGARRHIYAKFSQPSYNSELEPENTT